MRTTVLKELVVKNKCSLLCAIFFLWQLRLNQCYPMTSDDLYYLHAVRLNGLGPLWDYSLNWGNGRILGNFLGFVLVRNEMLKIFVKSLCLTGILAGLLKFLSVRKTGVMILAAILLSFPATRMFAQVYVWTVAFADYVPPIFLFLLYMNLTEIYSTKKENGRLNLLCRVGIYAAVFVLALAAQLFIEHCTVFFFLVSLVIMVVKIRENGHPRLIDMVRTAGCAVGACTMFMIPRIFRGDYGSVSGYRGESRLMEFLSVMCHNLYEFGKYTIGCLWFWMLFCAVMLIVIYRRRTFFTERKEKKLLCDLAIALYLCLPVLSLLFALDIYEIVNPRYTWVYVAVFGLELFGLSFAVCLLWSERRLRAGAVLVGAAMLSCAPLAVISLNNYRTFYLTYVCLAGALIYVIDRISQHWGGIKETRAVSYAAGMVFLAQVAALLLIAGDWKYTDWMRNKYFRRIAADHDIVSIDLPSLPHGRLLQADTDSNYWEYVIEDYWGLDVGEKSNVQINWHDWYGWLNVKESQ